MFKLIYIILTVFNILFLALFSLHTQFFQHFKHRELINYLVTS